MEVCAKNSKYSGDNIDYQSLQVTRNLYLMIYAKNTQLTSSTLPNATFKPRTFVRLKI